MTAIILSVGDELTLGQTIDTNSAWLSQQLATIGLPVRAHVTVPDDQSAIEQAIRDAAERAEIVLISGGIGPTPDDLTRQALAAVMNQPLELNEQWLAELRSFFAKRNRPMPDMNKIQAMIPRGANLIWNHNGTAAGIHAVLTHTAASNDVPELPPIDELMGRPLGRVLTKLGRLTRDQLVEGLTIQKQQSGLIGEILIKLGHVTALDIETAVAAQGGRRLQPIIDPAPRTHVFVMPGVPKEMKLMFERSVLPTLREKSSGAVILAKTLHTFGQGESTVAELLGPLMDRARNPTVGTTVSAGIVSVRINARFASKDEAQRELDATTQECHRALGDLIFGADDQSLAEVVAQLLASSRKTVTTAESCTGGLLAKYLTDIPGSSAYFKQGWITYSNEAKHSLLGVTVGPEGAVSEQTASAMASGALHRASAHYALSISGIAGPEGGTPQKPVGTVCIALATHNSVTSRTFLFPGDREMIRDRSAKMALTMLRYHLLGKPVPF